MVVAQLVSWHPVVSNCVAVTAGAKVHIVELSEDDTAVSVHETPSIAHFDWKHTTNLQAAYGTSTGNVAVLNPDRGDETILVTKRSCNNVCWGHLDKHKIAIGLEAMKGSDSSMFIWDVEHDVTLKLPIAETCSAITWHADHPQQLLFGNSLGTLRLVDLRIHHAAASSSASSAVYSIQAHPATRPRRIRGIRVNPLLSNVAATFSDAAGDIVKVWDLRTLGSSSSLGSKSVPLFAINPYLHPGGSSSTTTGHHTSQLVASPGCVADVAWSPRSAFSLATATTCQSAIHIFRCDGHTYHAGNDVVAAALGHVSAPSPVLVPNQTQAHSMHSHPHSLTHAATAPSVTFSHTHQPSPELTIPLSEPAKAIAWQNDSHLCARYRNMLVTSHTNSVFDFKSLTTPTHYAKENVQSMRMSMQAHGNENGIWESSGAEDRHNVDDDMVRQQRRYQLDIGCAALKTNNTNNTNIIIATTTNNINNNNGHQSKTNDNCFGLLAIATSQGLSIVSSHHEPAVAVSFTTGHVAIGDNVRRSVLVAPCESLCRAATLGDYMTASAEDRQRDRALAGYSPDIPVNVEILTEEAAMLSSTISKLRSSVAAASGASNNGHGYVHGSAAHGGGDVVTTCELQKLKRALIQVQEIQRVWQWLSRLLAATQTSSPSAFAPILLQRGARGLMRHLQASTPFIPSTRVGVQLPTPSVVVASDALFNKALGLMLYTSKARADILSLLSAWPATSSSTGGSGGSNSSHSGNSIHNHSNSSSSSGSDSSSGNGTKGAAAVVEVSASSVPPTPVSLECQAVRLLWRGQIDQSVALLLSSLNAGAANKKSAGPGAGFLHHATSHHHHPSGSSQEYQTLVEMTAHGLSGYIPNPQTEFPAPNNNHNNLHKDGMTRNISSASNLDQIGGESGRGDGLVDNNLHHHHHHHNNNTNTNEHDVNTQYTASPSRRTSHVHPLHAQPHRHHHQHHHYTHSSHAQNGDETTTTTKLWTSWGSTVNLTLDRWQRYSNSARHMAMQQPPTARQSLPLHRTNQLYLRAALQFLLVAEEHSCSMPLSTSNGSSKKPDASSKKPDVAPDEQEKWRKRNMRHQSHVWLHYLQESDIMQQIPFLDRLAFAAIYLKDEDFFAWIDSQIANVQSSPRPVEAVDASAASFTSSSSSSSSSTSPPPANSSWKHHKSLEVLALVGLETAESIHVLQAHIDHFDDLQTVALLAVSGVFRQRNSALTVNGPSPSFGTSNPLAASSSSSSSTSSSSSAYCNTLIHASTTPSSSHVASVVDVDRTLARWVLQYRQLLVHWEMVPQRVVLDEAVNTQAATFPYVFFTNYQGYDSYGGRRSPAFIDACTVFKTADALPKDLVKKHMATSGIRVRCTYCGSALPPLHQLMDLWKQKQREIGRLKNEKKVLNFCIKCTKRQHLPRCYVCQLFVGMLNPYRLVESLTEQGKQQKDGILSLQRQMQQALANANANAGTTTGVGAGSVGVGGNARIHGGGNGSGNHTAGVNQLPSLATTTTTAVGTSMRPGSMQKGGGYARPPPHQGAATSGSSGMGGAPGGGPGNASGSTAAAYYQSRMVMGRGGPPPRPPPSVAVPPPPSTTTVGTTTTTTAAPASADGIDESGTPTTTVTPSTTSSMATSPWDSQLNTPTDSSTTDRGAKASSFSSSSSSSTSSSTLKPAPSATASGTSSSGGGGGALSGGEAAAAALAAAAREQREKEKSTFNDLSLPFDDWLLYCQRCRHGGHSICLRRWFSRMTSQAEIELDKPSTYAYNSWANSDDDDDEDNINNNNSDDNEEGDAEAEKDEGMLLCYPVDTKNRKINNKKKKSSSSSKRAGEGRSRRSGSNAKKVDGKDGSGGIERTSTKRQICGVNGCDCRCDLSFE